MPIHMKTFFNTVIFSGIVTFITFVMSYPLAYYLAKIVSPASLPTLILLLFIPLWVIGSAARLRLVHHPDAQRAAERHPRRHRTARATDPLADRRRTTTRS